MKKKIIQINKLQRNNGTNSRINVVHIKMRKSSVLVVKNKFKSYADLV